MMTESGTGLATIVWNVPQCPFQIEASTRVLDDIRLAVVDAFFSVPRGGLEIGGILLGTYHSGRLSITGYAALDCEHAFGPSFTLSPADEERLKSLLIVHTGSPKEPRPVGWYHSHTRSEIFLSEADLQIHNRYFPERWQVALVVKPHTFQPARAGFFFREADGNTRIDASYKEITLDLLPVQRPGEAPVTESKELPPLGRWRSEPEPEEPPAEAPPVAEPQPVPISAAPPDPVAQPAPEPQIDLPAPQFLPSEPPPSRRWIWMLVLGVAVGVGAAGFQTKQAWLPRVLAAVHPPPTPAAPPPSLGLNLTDRDGQLQISWDRNSPALSDSRDASLEITDGPNLQAIPLDSVHLFAGSIAYVRQSERVDVKLVVHQMKGRNVQEVTSFLGELPGRQTGHDSDAQKQREDLAKESAKLKSDLNWQVMKTKKLEKDLESMREEMRQQQMRRLNNQLPDR